jgi:signal transduction histidine kinase
MTTVAYTYNNMNDFELLRKHKEQWLELALFELAPGTTLKSDFIGQLDRFFDLLDGSLQDGNLHCFDPLLEDWAKSHTRTDVKGSPSNFTQFINHLLRLLNQVAKVSMDATQYAKIANGFIYSFGYIFEKAAELEIKAHLKNADALLKIERTTSSQVEQSKSAFIAVAAHELRTPLTLIEGYNDMLEEIVTNFPEADNISNFTQGIKNGTRRLSTIINDMIDVSLVDNNLLELSFQPIWVNHIIEALSYELKPALTSRQQTLAFAPFDGFDQMTYGDPERLLQVFRNVLINAIKYTPDDGLIKVSGQTLPGFIGVTITDTGIGIDPEYLSSIFGKFGHIGNTMLHSSGKSKFKGGGPGLGLYIAKGLIEAHGGTIWAESPGYDEVKYPGSTFHIMLPLHKSNPTEKDISIALTDNQKLELNE